MSADPFDELERMLSSLFGEQMAADAVQALRSSGVDPESLAQMPGMADVSQLSPGQLLAIRAQFQQMFHASPAEPVNWAMGQDLALQQARRDGDPMVSASQAEAFRQALQVADLWLDTATELMPAPGAREAWTRSGWVERTLPVWKEVCAPVAEAVTAALSATLEKQIRQMPEEMAQAAQQMGALGSIMRTMSGTAFGLQVGQAVGALATEALGATDTGLPLTREPGTALLPANVTAFAEGLEIEDSEARMFLAVREAATARLYAHVPWLRGQVMGAVEAYAREIRIDTEALESAVAQVDPHDPEALRAALEGGMFAPQETRQQREALERLETLLALVEGWVEVVTAQAVAPHLPHAMALAEMIRRRRAHGGPAEQVFARLIGLAFRPRRAREAAQLWTHLGASAGIAERDALWEHPDVMPSPAELVNPEDFLTMRRMAQDMDAEMDADLASLLDGTLGYTEGARQAGAQPAEGGQAQDGADQAVGETAQEAAEPGAGPAQGGQGSGEGHGGGSDSDEDSGTGSPEAPGS
ncbi:zinc-dependent metalloprotease [Actinomyces bowdenii]|uniref:zinc-dependent metalloprotease n=1 Tax=Actinomyces bowdenii TaxID=131109 RepID=UPI001ABC2813|nr:zinc-dependent metalloprotease [Actinomyces bowdenii]MBO3724877.1 zinc-dependent metalloprotease [Actinomyces bowdenii]